MYCTLHDKKRLTRCLNLRFEQTIEVQADSRTKGNVEPFSRAIETCFFVVMAISRNAGTTSTTVIKTSNSFIELVIVRPVAMLTRQSRGILCKMVIHGCLIETLVV